MDRFLQLESLTNGVLKCLKGYLLCLGMLQEKNVIRHSGRQTDRRTDEGYLLCIRALIRAHVYLQRNYVSNTLPLRQTILI